MQKKRSSLVFKLIVGGFLTMIILATTAPYWMTGGAHAISPNGSYRLHVTTALNPNYFSYYTISLQRRSQNAETRQIDPSSKRPHEIKDFDVDFETIETVTLRPHLSPVSCPRGSTQPVRWSPESDFVDVYIDDKPLCRIYIPN